MTITTVGTVANLSPVVFRTFFKHFYTRIKKAKEERDTEATDEFLFDEAFQVTKSFIETATHDTVEALQTFTNTHFPAPPWAVSVPTLVPIQSCDDAAQLLKQYFSPQDLKNLVGGEKWWQIRGVAGVQAEWIAMSSDWTNVKSIEQSKGFIHHLKKNYKRNLRHVRKLARPTGSTHPNDTKHANQNRQPPTQTTDDSNHSSSDPAWEHIDENSYTEELDRLQRVMLYIHGGGYFFGSLSTHRYQIVRYARKFGGRCFAPLYRKAPQYPWPCALQDVLASYLFLIRPPAGASYQPVDPKKLVIAGDSAGGGLAISLLTVLRDLDLPMPAGAVLISPWCDMTHSFPSVMENTATDIIPPYSFIHKPSTLWPVSGVAPEPGEFQSEKGRENKPQRTAPTGVDNREDVTQHGEKEEREEEEHQETPAANQRQETTVAGKNVDPIDNSIKASTMQPTGLVGIPPSPRSLLCKPIQVITSDPTKPNIQLNSQIQLYATNEQLIHPLCSPILHGSLGGLPPLYILAGDKEVLRDEIIYVAHRAAHPHRYPLRQDLIDRCPRVKNNAERFDSQPTKVHLQIYDDMCHVLTAFAFTSQARFAYRAVASFVKHVTGAPTNIKNPFPDVREGGLGVVADSDSEVLSLVRTVSSTGQLSTSRGVREEGQEQLIEDNSKTSATSMDEFLQIPSTLNKPHLSPLNTLSASIDGSRNMVESPLSFTASPDKHRNETGDRNGRGSSSLASSSFFTWRHRSKSYDSKTNDTVQEERTRTISVGVGNEYTGQVPLMRPSFKSYMIRERVDVHGFLRPLEPENEIPALQLEPEEIGIIKEGPCSRYLTGQKIWAKKYASTAKKVEKRRAKNEEKAQKILKEAAARGLLEPIDGRGVVVERDDKDAGEWTGLASFGPTDLTDETPPPSAIAGRRDTEEALVLLRTSLKMRAEQYGGDKKDRKKDKEGIPQQSVAETSARGQTRQGIRFWNYMMVHGHRNSMSSKRTSRHSSEARRNSTFYKRNSTRSRPIKRNSITRVSKKEPTSASEPL